MKELRMYFFVMGNIGTIDKGIQAGHCSQEYTNLFSKKELYKDWFKNFKTFILLSGGTSNNGFTIDTPWDCHFDETKLGSMELHEKFLIDNHIPHASFHEPDLNNSLSALCFICDNKVFDWENYPSFEKWIKLNPPTSEEPFDMEMMKSQWTDLVGGEQNVKLKELIYGKKLA